MRPAYQPRPTRWAAGATLALLALVLCAPSTARAGCSRHYSATVDPEVAAAGFEHLAHSGAMAEPTRLPMEPKRSPCPGGICSPAPYQPIAPTPAPLPRAEHWGCLPTIEPPAAEPGTVLHLEDPAMRPIGRSLAIFHPPRAA